jgi:hypothetical protein
MDPIRLGYILPAESGAVRHEAKIVSAGDCESDLVECVLVTRLPRFDELPVVSNSVDLCVGKPVPRGKVMTSQERTQTRC